jgi:hypothetical protein
VLAASSVYEDLNQIQHGYLWTRLAESEWLLLQCGKMGMEPEADREQKRAGLEIGSWARLNCENMPVNPAWLVRSNLTDPRGIPYLLIWKDERHGGEIKEAVRLARFVEPSNSRVNDNYVDLKRTDGSTTVLRFDWRMLPRNGGRANEAKTDQKYLPFAGFAGVTSAKKLPWKRISCKHRNLSIRHLHVALVHPLIKSFPLLVYSGESSLGFRCHLTLRLQHT